MASDLQRWLKEAKMVEGDRALASVPCACWCEHSEAEELCIVCRFA